MTDQEMSLIAKKFQTFQGNSSCVSREKKEMRKLKPHEQKLLKKVDPYYFKREENVRELKIIRRYHIQNRDDYTKYNMICGEIKMITNKLLAMEPEDRFRIEMTEHLLDKLYNMGIIHDKKSLAKCGKITASAFCRRRIPVVLVRLNMAENLKEAVTFVEQGHVRVGPNVVTDPAFLVTRTFEDFVTWVDDSKIRQKVLAYNDQLDDYTLLGL